MEIVLFISQNRLIGCAGAKFSPPFCLYHFAFVNFSDYLWFSSRWPLFSSFLCHSIHFVFLLGNVSVSPSLCSLSVTLSIFLSLCLTLCHFVYLSVTLSIFLSLCLSLCHFVYLSVTLSIFVSLCLSLSPWPSQSFFTSLCFCICVSICFIVFCVYLCPSVYVTVYLQQQKGTPLG